MWIIYGEEVIVLGDKTTHGGEVVTASEKVVYLGKPVACVGDQVTCPRCEGMHTIISGAPTATAYDKAIARNGDSVSCGAKLISASNNKPSSGMKVLVAASNDHIPLAEEEKEKRFIYVPHKENLQASALAVILKGDFPPAAASYSIEIIVIVEDRKLWVAADGRTGLLSQPHPPKIDFSAEAIITKEGTEIARQSLKWKDHGYLLDPQTLKRFIGEATFILPEPVDTIPLTLTVTGGYFVLFPEGSAAPAGQRATAIHQLPVVESE
ncbi:MAG: PAAR domain-containing protein [Desulfarculales bacterium]|jgi:uncharacterized Zn-binding protein involved in type VI secretion|nr:PAAR domain-containing protein [Desulfarculales bacterium]